MLCMDRLYDLVVRVPDYRSREPRFDSRRYQIFWEVVGLERVHSASWVQLRSGGRSVGIVRLRTKATEFFMCFYVRERERNLI
jgi:hypothetical protein